MTTLLRKVVEREGIHLAHGIMEWKSPSLLSVSCLLFRVCRGLSDCLSSRHGTWSARMKEAIKTATFLPLKTLFIVCLCTYAYSTVYLCRSEDNLWEFILLPCEFWALKSGQQA